MKLNVLCCLLFLLAACKTFDKPSDNLITNGSAELSKADSIGPIGWSIVRGAWRPVAGGINSSYETLPQDGKLFFFAGADSFAILEQRVDVSRYAASIDHNDEQFIFKGYARSLQQNPDDLGFISVNCYDAGNKSLLTYKSDSLDSTKSWQVVTDTFFAPATTRIIEVRLMGDRKSGFDNDAYYDNITLVARTADDYTWILIAIVAIVAVVLLIVIRRARGRAK